MAGLAARVMAVREAPVAGVLTAIDDELEVAHGCSGNESVRGSESKVIANRVMVGG